MKKSIWGIMIVMLLGVISVMSVLATEETQTITAITFNLNLGDEYNVNVVEVTLDAKGGTFQESCEINEIEGETLTKLELEEWIETEDNKPERTGYEFNGWWIETDDKQERINDANMVCIPNGTTIYAHWRACKYTVTFEDQGTTVGELLNVVYGEKYGKFPLVEDGNWDFLGWYTEGTDGVKIEETDFVDLMGDCILYARWGKEFNIQFIIKQMTISHNITILRGEIYTYEDLLVGLLPDITDSNFTGWSTDENDEIVNGEDTINIEANGITLYAQWEMEYTITFNPNGGSCNESTRLIKASASYGELPTPTRENYTFLGWFTEEVGGIEILSENIPAEDKTLYAHWEEVEYTITFNPNGGSCNELTRLINAGGSYGELPMPTRENYIFLGWFNEEIGGIEILPENIPAEDKTLYAHWEEVEYTITFNPNGGSCNESTRPIKSSASYGELPMPTRANYTFLGWYTQISGGKKVESVDKPDKNITLYAQWQLIVVPKTYKITLNPKGGTCKNKVKEVAAGHTCKGSELETPTRKGYVFVGWKNGSTVITKDDTLTVNKDLTLEAIWVGTLKKKNVKVSCYQWATGAEISWNTVDGATEYQISYKKKGEKDSEYKKLASVKNPKNKKTLKTRITKKSKKLKNNMQYVFKVEACYKSGNKILKTGSFAEVSHKTKPAITVKLSKKGNLYELRWGKLDSEIEKIEVYTKSSAKLFAQTSQKGITYMSVGVNRVKKGTKFYIKVTYRAKGKGQKKYCDISNTSTAAN